MTHFNILTRYPDIKVKALDVLHSAYLEARTFKTSIYIPIRTPIMSDYDYASLILRCKIIVEKKYNLYNNTGMYTAQDAKLEYLCFIDKLKIGLKHMFIAKLRFAGGNIDTVMLDLSYTMERNYLNKYVF